MHQNIIAPLLNDSRLTLPSLESSKFASGLPMALGGLKTIFNAHGGGARGAGAVTGAAGRQVARDSAGVVAGAPGAVARGVVGASGALARGAAATVVGGTKGLGQVAKNLAPATSGKVVGAVENIPAAAAAAGARRDAAFAGGRASTNPNAPQPIPTPTATSTKEVAHNQATAAGADAAPGSMSHTLQNLGGMKATGIGALAGGLKGIVDPGTYTDDNGNVQQRSRIGAAITGGATGAAAGALAAPLIRGGARMHAATPKTPAVGPGSQFNRFTGETVKTNSKIAHLLPSIDSLTKVAMLPGGLDASANNAAFGPAATNVMSTPKVADMAHAPEDMSEGAAAAKAEEKERAKRVEAANKMGAANVLAPAMNPAISTKLPTDKSSKPAFPNLKLKK